MALSKFKHVDIIKNSLILILISVALPFHFYVANFKRNDMDLTLFWWCLLGVSTLSFLLFVLSYVIFRNTNKAFLLSYLTIPLFLYFKYIVDSVLGAESISLVTIFIIYIIVFIGLGYLISKINLKNVFSRVTTATLVAICLFHAQDIYQYTKIIGYRSIGGNNRTYNHITTKKSKFSPQKRIYVITLDAHPSLPISKQIFDYDFSPFETALKNKGFFIPKRPRANYTVTTLYLKSVLNQMQIPSFKKNFTEFGYNSYGEIKTKLAPGLLNKLHENNYTTYWFKASDFSASNKYARFEIENGSRFFLFVEFLNTSAAAALVRMRQINRVSDRLHFHFQELDRLQQKNEQQFVWAHILPTHPPFVLKENGDSYSSEELLPTALTWGSNRYLDKKIVVSQFKFTHKRIINFVNKLKPDDVVIIMSDHGSQTLSNWKDPSDDFIFERLSNFIAIRTPEKFKEKLKDNLTPMRAFSIALEAAGLESTVKDDMTSYYSTYENRYELIDKTDFINKYYDKISIDKEIK